MFTMLSRLTDRLDQATDLVLPTLARLAFAAVLFVYFWGAALTKLEGGLFSLFSPGINAYAQIFPRALEAVGYDASQMSGFAWAVVVAGTVAEFVLPVLIVIGLFTRLAALGMIGFTVVQSLTDIIGHKADPTTIGAWFDNASGSLILDQRTLWVVLFMILVMRGAGPLSLDRLLFRNAP